MANHRGHYMAQEGMGKTWGSDGAIALLPWQEVDEGCHSANLGDILGNAWETIRQDTEFYGVNYRSLYD